MPEVDTALRVLLVTAPAEAAPALVRALVERRLVACGNIVPGVRSIYVWNGEVCDEQEVVILLETAAVRVDAAMQAIRATHPYACPKIVAFDPAAVDRDYAAWVVAATTAPPVNG
ncbi:MAG: divalent-cation tolerance protein CutA [Myxococcales bacterium]|jgi:periplasmic divalent cation tolerance protein|nr:divalent-cation tolerance protein CutA [Myxococcales bacterium]